MKKIAAIVLCLAVALTMASCGKNTATPVGQLDNSSEKINTIKEEKPAPKPLP